MAGGKRRADTHNHARPRLGPLSRLGGYVLGIILGGVAWWYLVRAAIDFGHVALAGDVRAWLFTAAASGGAVGCLLLVIVLASRVLVTLGVVSEYQPRRAAPRRRAEPAKSDPAGAIAAAEAGGDAVSETPTDENDRIRPADRDKGHRAAEPSRRAAGGGHRAAEPTPRAAQPRSEQKRRAAERHRHVGSGGRRGAAAVRHADAPEADGTSG